MKTSLTAWCRDNDLAKATVHGKCRELGIDTSKGLSDDAVKQLNEYYEICDKTTVVDPTEPEINSGNHRQNAELTPIRSQVDLSNLRAGSELTTVDNKTLEQVDQALTLIDGVLGAIDSDTAFQIEQLKKTSAATDKLQRKADQLRIKKAQYSVESKLIGLMQENQTSSLKDSMAEIAELLDPEE